MYKIKHKEATEVQNTCYILLTFVPVLFQEAQLPFSALFYPQGYRTLNHTSYPVPFSRLEELLYHEDPLRQSQKGSLGKINNGKLAGH